MLNKGQGGKINLRP